MSSKKAKTKTPTEQSKPKPVIVPDAELLDLTEGNFEIVMQKLGAKDVTTAMMLPYFKISKDLKPQNRWPKLRNMAVKLSKQKPPKIAIVKDGKDLVTRHACVL